jgi:hypothetical protein
LSPPQGDILKQERQNQLLHRNLGALRGRIAPAEGVAENKMGKAHFGWSEGETSPLKIAVDFDFDLEFDLSFDF